MVFEGWNALEGDSRDHRKIHINNIPSYDNLLVMKGTEVRKIAK